MRFVSKHNHVRTVTELLRRLKFVDEREDVAVISSQQFPQMGTAGGVTCITLRFAHGSARLESLGELVV